MPRDLVERAMAGDHEAFSELARLGIRRLYAAARLILRDAEAAEDATQEALVAAWRDIGSLRDPDRFEPWLHRLLVRECYREASRGRRRNFVRVASGPSRTSRRTPVRSTHCETNWSAASAGSMSSSGPRSSCITPGLLGARRSRMPCASPSAPSSRASTEGRSSRPRRRRGRSTTSKDGWHERTRPIDTTRLEETSRVLADWFEMDASPHEPVDLLSATLYRTARTRRRAAGAPRTGGSRSTLHRASIPDGRTHAGGPRPCSWWHSWHWPWRRAVPSSDRGPAVGTANDGRNTLPAVALLPTGCPAATPEERRTPRPSRAPNGS